MQKRMSNLDQIIRLRSVDPHLENNFGDIDRGVDIVLDVNSEAG